MCTKWFLRRLGPHSQLPHLKRLVCMEILKNVQNFPTYRGSPFIETPLTLPCQKCLYHINSACRKCAIYGQIIKLGAMIEIFKY